MRRRNIKFRKRKTIEAIVKRLGIFCFCIGIAIFVIFARNKFVKGVRECDIGHGAEEETEKELTKKAFWQLNVKG